MNLQSFFFDFMMKTHVLYMEIESVGLRVDFEKRAQLYDKYSKRFKEVNDRLTENLGYPLNVNSPRQVALTVFQHLKCPARANTSEETLISLMVNTVKDGRRRQILSDIIEGRKLRKTINTYICALPDFDGRMRTSYRITGTETGRTSTSVLKPPLRWSLKHRGKKLTIGMAFQTITKHGDVGADIREMFIPDEGCAFVEVDSSQAEARIVALLAEDHALLNLFDSGQDVHKITAGRIFKVDPSKISREERFLGKKGRHSFNYDIKKHTFMLDVNKEARKAGIDISISEWRAGKILDELYTMHPNVKSVFHAEVQRILGRDRTMYNPFGRRRVFFGRWDEQLFREGYANIPQGTVGDNTKLAMLRTRDRIPDLRICMESHDSFTAIVPIDKIDKYAPIMAEEMSRPIDFSNCSIPRGTIIIPAEVKVGYKNLKDMQDYTL